MTQTAQIDAVVAGHICLDIIPTFEERGGSRNDIRLVPGRLVNVGPAHMATGGAVSNTGLALHRLGINTRLMGKIGADLFGNAILDVIRQRDPELTAGMVVSPDATSSYTIVISQPNIDRSFLHCPGANDTFGAGDVDVEQMAGARVFHFGYPPLMRRMYADGGAELTAIFQRVKEAGLTTSLDMAHVDVDSPGASVDWRKLLEQVLPYVDIFLPSLEEVFFMLDRNRYQKLVDGTGADTLLAHLTGTLLQELTDELLNMGPAIAGLKMGDQGIYLRTTSNEAKIAELGRCSLPSTWSGRELLAPAFQVNVIGTTGAGDCAIAGFLAGLLRGLPIETALNSAVGAGAANVEHADAISGVPTWSDLQSRIQEGWERTAVNVPLPGWTSNEKNGLWIGPSDRINR